MITSDPNLIHKNAYKEIKRRALVPSPSALIPPVTCIDGYSISIQASSAHYCLPRETLNPFGDDEYVAFELGYPSEPDELITPYAEDEEDLTGTIYPFVDTEIVTQLLEKHGGVSI